MQNKRPDFDQEIQDIANYICDYQINSALAYETAYYDCLDTLACGFMALQFPACKTMLGPIVECARLKNGAVVPGTPYELDPVQAAFNIGAMIRWLDFNDTWLAAEWGHPSDNLGGILAAADYLNRKEGRALTMQDILTAMIKAHEIQGILALENSFNRVGLDHVILVKVATTAVVAHMLGCTREQICNAISLAWVDGQSLRTYRHAPNTGSRKSWAAGDATSRGVWLALMARRGAMGYPTALSAKTWGFYDVSFEGKRFAFQRPYGNYVMENVLFKIAFPAEFHAQTAVEAAIALRSRIKRRFHEIERICIRTHEAAIRIIAKEGPLHNPADRDHCLQYMVAVALIEGKLTAAHYEDAYSRNPEIDRLRKLMRVEENPQFTLDYHDPEKRAISNTLQIYFKDGSSTRPLTVEYPIGHRRRRAEGVPLLLEKYEKSVKNHFNQKDTQEILEFTLDRQRFFEAKVNALTEILSIR